MQTLNMIICITGTPKTGKTEVSEALARRLGCRAVHLNDFARERKLFSGYDRKRGVDVVDIGRLGKEISRMAGKGEENLVMESHYSHLLPCDVIVVLRTGISELRERMDRAGWFPQKTEENIQAEIMEVCLSEALETGRKVIQVDTTRKVPEEAAGEIEKELF
jgi:adenylate kinase